MIFNKSSKYYKKKTNSNRISADSLKSSEDKAQIDKKFISIANNFEEE